MGMNRYVPLGSLVQRSMCKLKDLNLQWNVIDDEGMRILIDALAKNNSLKKLSLAESQSISRVGWRDFSSFLSNSNSGLEKLHLDNTGIDDEVAATLVNGLANNTKSSF